MDFRFGIYCRQVIQGQNDSTVVRAISISKKLSLLLEGVIGLFLLVLSTSSTRILRHVLESLSFRPLHGTYFLALGGSLVKHVQYHDKFRSNIIYQLVYLRRTPKVNISKTH